jgi:hypothetical protein
MKNISKELIQITSGLVPELMKALFRLVIVVLGAFFLFLIGILSVGFENERRREEERMLEY